MSSLLLIAHVLLFAGVLIYACRNRFAHIATTTLPIAIGFMYISVVQAIDAIRRPSDVITEESVASGLLISAISFAAFLAGYFIAGDLIRVRPIVPQRSTKKLLWVAAVLIGVGAAGQMIVIQTVGGWTAFLGFQSANANQYEVLSAYLYNLPNFLFAAFAVLSVTALGERQRKSLYLIALATGLLLVLRAIALTDRGDLIRSMLPLAALLTSSQAGLRRKAKAWSVGKIVAVGAVALVALGVLVLPFFRDTGRSILTSNVSFDEAIEGVLSMGASSRFSARGGEFDSAVRLVQQVQTDYISPPGPIHLAHVIWGFVPRHLVPEKHELFANWAGEDYEKILLSASYPGCALTGWGEAYAYLGFVGSMIYWMLLGAAGRWFESLYPDPNTLRIASATAFLPMAQFVVMGLWAGIMNTLYAVLPFCLALRFATTKSSRRLLRAYRRMSAFAPLPHGTVGPWRGPAGVPYARNLAAESTRQSQVPGTRSFEIQ